MYPAEWARDPAFAVNLRLCSVTLATAWMAFSFFAANLGPDDGGVGLACLAALSTCVAISIAGRLRDLHRFTEEYARVRNFAFLLGGTVGALSGVAARMTVGSLAGAGLLAATLLVLVLTWIVRRSDAFAARYLPGSPRRIALEQGLGIQARARQIIRVAIVLTDIYLFFARGGGRVVYSAWAGVACHAAALLRLRSEPRSVVCREPGCGLVFDDPELLCRCGAPGLRTFPRFLRPLAARCENCRRAVATWRSVDQLTAAGEARLGYSLCRLACQQRAADVPRLRRVLCVALDAGFATEFLRSRAAMVRTLERTDVLERFRLTRERQSIELALLRPSPSPFWAANWDAILVVPRSGDHFDSDLEFGVNQLGLPRSQQSWSGQGVIAPRGPAGRLLLPPRADPEAPYNARNMPVLTVAAERASERHRSGFSFVDRDVASIDAFLWRSQ